MTEPWPELVERLATCRRCHDEKLLHADARPLFCRARPLKSDLLFVLEAPNLADTTHGDKGYLTVDTQTEGSTSRSRMRA